MSKIALITYDYETTGADSSKDLPVQTAAVMSIDNGPHLPIVHALSNPGIKIHKEATEVHGILQHMIRGYPHPAIIVSMLATYVDSLSDADYTVIIAGHNHIRFDNKISVRLGWECINKYPQIDTFILARRYRPMADNHKLSDTYETAFGDSLEGAHDAMADVLGVARLVDYYCEVLKMDTLELANFCDIPQRMWVIPFGKHKGKTFKKAGYGFIKFMMQETDIASQDIDFLHTVKYEFPSLWEAFTGKDASNE